MYKIPLTVYSSKIPVHITGLEARWCFGKFYCKCFTFSYTFYLRIHVNKIHSVLYIYQFHLCIGSLSPSYTVTILGHGRATTHPDLSNRDASA